MNSYRNIGDIPPLTFERDLDGRGRLFDVPPGALSQEEKLILTDRGGGGGGPVGKQPGP